MPTTHTVSYPLLIAFRKAKQDLYYSSNPRILDLYAYEKNLIPNLLELQLAIRTGNSEWFSSREFLGSHSLIPSSVTEKEEIKDQQPDVLGTLTKISPAKKNRTAEATDGQTASFRLMEKCSIHFHVLASLWLAEVGSKFEEQVQDCAYANRIRRNSASEYNELAIGSFQPYFFNYRKWRDTGLQTIQDILENEQTAIAITSDISGYFHNLSPAFLQNSDFLKLVDYESLNPEQKDLHELFVESLIQWGKQVVSDLRLPCSTAGLPVGLAASGLIANLALIEFDRQIVNEVKPRFYGRYVDDIMIVLEGGEDFTSPHSVWEWIEKRVDSLTLPSAEPAKIGFEYLTNSDLRLGSQKSKILTLEGAPGKQILASLETAIREQTSEWRMLPSLPELPRDIATDILRIPNADGENVRKLSEITKLSSTRSGFAITLRNFEALQRDVEADSWSEYRTEFYNAVQEQIADVSKFFELASYFPRILSLALQCRDAQQVDNLFTELEQVVSYIQKNFRTELKSLSKPDENETQQEGGSVSLKNEILRCWKSELGEILIATIVASPGIPQEQSDSLLQRAALLGGSSDLQVSDLPTFQQLFCLDLASLPFKQILAPKELEARSDIPKFSNSSIPLISPQQMVLGKLKWKLLSLIRAFGRQDSGHHVPQLRWNTSALIFPTRPFSVSEILLWTRCLDPSTPAPELAKWLQVTRGYSGNKWLTTPSNTAKIILSNPDLPDRSGKVRVAVGSLYTSEDSFVSAVHRRPGLSIERYLQLTEFINSVLSVRDTIPHYLLLPEASIPPSWFVRFAQKLSRRNISLIAGVEYLHDEPAKEDQDHFHGPETRYVKNQQWHALVHDDLGFKSIALYCQDKQAAAPGEERNLWNLATARLQPEITWKIPPRIQHGNFIYAGLICSELTDVNNRAGLRGKVDALFISEWNKDLNTFDALVESSALDIHCYVAQSNNRLFGDSRIRAPYAEAFRRDVVRVRGGRNDHFVIGEIDVYNLRRFHSSYRADKGGYKPTPAGFAAEMDPRRRIIP